MSITSRMYRDDELSALVTTGGDDYEGQQYAFANHADREERTGTAHPLFVDDHHVDYSGPFRGVELPAMELPEYEPSDDELLAIEAEITGHHWTHPEVHEIERCGHAAEHCGEGLYCYPLNLYPPIPV